MTLAIFFAAVAMVRQTEYPFKPAQDVPHPTRYFRISPVAAPELVEGRDNLRAYPEQPDPLRIHEHAIEGRELVAFWAKPDPPPFPLPDPPKDYADWLERFAGKERKPMPGSIYSADALVSEFVAKRSGDTAFEIFLVLTAEGNGAHPYSEWTKEEAEYFLRFAANHGSARARQFFDDAGELKTGRAYEYVFAEYSPNYRVRRLYPYEIKGAPGNGMDGSFRPYEADAELKAQLERYSLEAQWFDYSLPDPPDPNVAGYKKAFENHHAEGLEYKSCADCLPPSLPFLAFRPRKADGAVPLVVYMPGSGEQGTDLKLQFRQTACMAKVVSGEFQERHPAYLLVIAPPSYGNVNVGYGYPAGTGNRVSAEYNDLILAYIRKAESPRIDPSRIYITGLGSGANIAMGMALDHPGRFAAVAPVWCRALSPIVHPERPGNWRIYNVANKPAGSEENRHRADMLDEFEANVRAGGGECSLVDVPGVKEGCWWDQVWSSDEVWEWMFSKRAAAK